MSPASSLPFVRSLLGAGLAAALLAGSSPAAAQDREIQLEWLRNAAARFDGPGGNAHAGRAVSAAGDVNGDGLDDFVVSGWDTGFFADPGTVWIVYGTSYGLPQTAGLGGADVVLEGISSGDEAGYALAAAGDVDDDGFDDVLIGIPRDDSNGTDSGAAVLLYGDAALPASIDLGNLASGQATVFRGIDFSDLCGSSVAGVGDVDGDGFDDVLIGAEGASPNGVSLAGQCYLVRGGAALGDVVELSGLTGTAGTAFNGISASDACGARCSAAGDVNGDGVPDLFIGAPNSNPGGKNNAGQGYVVYGSASLPAVIDLASLGSAGVTLNGEFGGDTAGSAVSGGGDVDGDGFDDVIIAAEGWDLDNLGDSNEGVAYLVYGGDALPSVIELGSLGVGGIEIQGASPDDEAGKTVALGGDMNKDGYADLLVAAWQGDSNGANSGEVHLVHGGPALPGTLVLDSVGSRGVQLNGVVAQDRFGGSTAFLGDVDGDGFGDYAVGSYFADTAGGDSGAVHVIKGACNFLQADGAAVEGGSWTFRMHGAPGVLWLLYLDVAVLPVPLPTNKGPFWLPSAISVLVFSFDANGETTFPLALPTGAGLAGNTLYWQLIQQPQGMHCDLSQLLATTFDP